jgi:alkylation response protein AidB-like acyl-CoA dehydrogenase
MSVAFTETEERQELRRQVARLASSYGREYFTRCARSGEKTTDLWLAIGKAGYLGINIPEEYGGGGGGIGDVAAVCEELAAQGCPLLMMVVSPAICGTVIARYGTEEQKRRWLPGICDGTETMAFAITEPDAGTNSHNITTTAKRDGDEWVLNGRKVYISGVDEAKNVLVVARTVGRQDRQAQALPVRGTDRRRGPRVHGDPDGDHLAGAAVPGLHRRPAAARRRAGRRRGRWARAAVRRPQPERIMAASFSTGLARYALDKATAYVKEREVWGTPDRRAPGPRAPAGAVEDRDRAGPADDAEGAALYDAGDDLGAGEAPTWRSTPPPRPPATPPTARCRPTAATASPRSTASPACWSPPAPAGSPRSAAR